MKRIDDIRDAVAKTLETRGFDNRRFIAEVRAGLRDDGPYMIGALAVAALCRMEVAAD